MKFRLDPIYASKRRAIKYVGIRAFIGFFIFWGVLYFLLPLCNIIGEGFTPLSFARARLFMKEAFFSPLLVLKSYQLWLTSFAFERIIHRTWNSFFAWNLPLLPTGIYIWTVYYYILNCPDEFRPMFFGDAREANEQDVEQMGLYKGKFLLLGKVFGRKMRLPDARSVLCMGTSGSGKTTGLIIPNVFELDKSCLIINDPKGEIFNLTSGYRSTLGPVFHFKWTAIDNPQKGEYWPSWNPLGTGNLETKLSKRNAYLTKIIGFLIPDGPEGTDPYWVKAGRDCMSGIGTYICNKVEQSKANDYFLSRLQTGKLDEEDYEVLTSYYASMKQTIEVQNALKRTLHREINIDNYLPIGSWEHIPKYWQGHDVSFAMMVDTINNWQLKETKALQERRDSGDSTAASMDVWQSIFTGMVLETAYYNYGRLTLLDLNQVLTLPDKQRASVVSMALSGINIFKSASARLRTSMNDIVFSNLRGLQDVNTEQYYPITIYLSVPYEDLGSSASMLNNLFINLVSSKLMSVSPNEKGFGPFATAFLLDDFQHMPVLKSITDGLVFGRSKMNSYFFTFQDWHQLSKKYGEKTTEVLLNMPGAKILKRCNNIDTRNKMMKGLGDTTKIKYSIGEDYLPFNHLQIAKKYKYSTYKDGAIGKSGILKMKPEKQLLIYSGHADRPIKCDTPLFFKNETYKKKSKITPAKHVPKYIMDLRKEKNPMEFFRLRIDEDA